MPVSSNKSVSCIININVYIPPVERGSSLSEPDIPQLQSASSGSGGGVHDLVGIWTLFMALNVAIQSSDRT